MGAPPRLAAASRLHESGSTASSQPPDPASCASAVWVAQAVTIRQSVTGSCADWVKSTSKRTNGAPKGTHCTEKTPRFGGNKAVSGGYTSFIGGALDGQGAAAGEGNVQPGQSGAVIVPIAAPAGVVTASGERSLEASASIPGSRSLRPPHAPMKASAEPRTKRAPASSM